MASGARSPSPVRQLVNCSVSGNSGDLDAGFSEGSFELRKQPALPSPFSRISSKDASPGLSPCVATERLILTTTGSLSRLRRNGSADLDNGSEAGSQAPAAVGGGGGSLRRRKSSNGSTSKKRDSGGSEAASRRRGSGGSEAASKRRGSAGSTAGGGSAVNGGGGGPLTEAEGSYDPLGKDVGCG